MTGALSHLRRYTETLCCFLRVHSVDESAKGMKTAMDRERGMLIGPHHKQHRAAKPVVERQGLEIQES